MYQDILVPANGTEESETAIPHAFDIAKERGATVHTLCAYSRQSRYGALSVESAETREESIHEQAEQIVDEVAERAAEEGIDCITTIREGDPTEGIVDYVEDEGIDLIVIGARKRSPTGKVLFGSVSQSVILNTDIPVIVTGG